MNEDIREKRWLATLAQIDRFAEADQLSDALARVNGLRDEIESALAITNDPVQRNRIRCTSHLIEEEVERIQSLYNQWIAATSARQSHKAHADIENQKQRPT